MKEKGIKKLKIQLNNETEEISLNKSEDFLLLLDCTKEVIELQKELRFTFTKPDISSDLKIRVVISTPSQITLKLIVHAPVGAKNSASTLDMKALVLNSKARIEFVPSLEIDEKEVSLDHKSTIGVPDQEVLNYMMSRGLSYQASLDQLVSSFINM
ncbi:MAG: hypothetical protein Fur003_5230 [Candidatus Dojkabacteria bacterium]